MNIKVYKDKIRLILLIMFFFTLPNSVAINNVIFGMIILYWLLLGDKKKTFELIKINPFVTMIYIFFTILCISLLWTSNIKWGIHILNKELMLLSIPIFMTLINKKEINLLIKTFILAMTISEIISYGVKLEIIPPVFHATSYDPTPFTSHISYNPFLAFTIYLLIYFLFTSKESIFIKVLSIFFIITMSINQFITGGRAGQIAFFVLLILASVQFVKLNIKSLLFIGIGIPLIFLIAYNESKIFHNRINLAIYNVKHFKTNPKTSIGQRIVFIQTTLELIKKNPLLGVGVGDYTDEYKKINQYSNINPPSHPHNMYLFVWAESGIFGFLAFVSIFIIQMIAGIKIKDEYQPLRIALPLLFLVIMFSDCYLLGYFTTHLFIAFSSLLYKELTWKLIKS